MKQVFELLARNNLSKTKYEETIRKWPSTKLLDFIEQFNNSITYERSERLSSFDFMANTQLSGGVYPCKSRNCRIEHVDKLSRFAALYADKVLVRNPLDRYRKFEQIHDQDKVDIANDLSVIYHLEPLLKAGVVGFSLSRIHFCTNCYTKYVGETGITRDAISDMREMLTDEYIRQASYVLDCTHGTPYLLLKGLEEFSHTRAFTYRNLPDFLRQYVDRSKTKPITIRKNSKAFSSLVERMKISLVNPVIDDVVMQEWYSSLHGMNYITDRDVDLDIISLINDHTTNLINSNVMQALSHSVPIVPDVDISKLVSLRKEEGEAFRVYRDAITKTIREARKLKPIELEQILDDLIRPEINNIEMRVRNSRKLLQESTKKDLLLLSGFVALALYSGLLPKEIPIEVVGMLGGAKSGLDLLIKTLDSFKEPHEIRDNKFYFLWKAQKRAYKKERKRKVKVL